MIYEVSCVYIDSDLSFRLIRFIEVSQKYILNTNNTYYNIKQ